MYIGDYWHELWNTESKGWQNAQRIGAIAIFIAFVFIAIKYGAGSTEMNVATVLVPLIVVGVVAVSFFLVFIPYRLWRSVRHELSEAKRHAVEFYTSRSEFDRARGTLLEVIAPCREIWLAMWTGSKTWQDEVFKEKSVKRLLIQHPGYCLVETFAKTERGDLGTYRRNIVSTTSSALDNSVPVVWANEAIIGLIVANPREVDHTGWVRAEYFIPHSPTPVPYPSVIVYEANKAEEALYRRLVKSYEDMFSSELNVQVTRDMLQEWKTTLGM